MRRRSSRASRSAPSSRAASHRDDAAVVCGAQQSGVRGHVAGRLSQQGLDPVEPAALRVLDRSNAVALRGQLDVRPGVDEPPHDAFVGLATPAQDDRLVQGRPSQLVDVVDLDAGVEQSVDDRRESAFGGADEPGAVEAVLGLDAGTVAQHEVEQSRVVTHLAGGDEVGALLRAVLVVDVGAGIDERAGNVEVVPVGREDQRGGAANRRWRRRRPPARGRPGPRRGHRSRRRAAVARPRSGSSVPATRPVRGDASEGRGGGRLADDGDADVTGAADGPVVPCPAVVQAVRARHSTAAPRDTALMGQGWPGRSRRARAACGR